MCSSDLPDGGRQGCEREPAKGQERLGKGEGRGETSGPGDEEGPGASEGPGEGERENDSERGHQDNQGTTSITAPAGAPPAAM